MEDAQAQGPNSSRCQTPLLHVSNCQSPIVSSIIAGPYVLEGTNHGRPIYRKQGVLGSANVLVYFWDERDGPAWAGWWFAPKIGWEDPGWAHHDDRVMQTPPLSGWRVPVDGPVDGTLRLSFVAR